MAHIFMRIVGADPGAEGHYSANLQEKMADKMIGIMKAEFADDHTKSGSEEELAQLSDLQLFERHFKFDANELEGLLNNAITAIQKELQSANKQNQRQKQKQGQNQKQYQAYLTHLEKFLQNNRKDIMNGLETFLGLLGKTIFAELRRRDAFSGTIDSINLERGKLAFAEEKLAEIAVAVTAVSSDRKEISSTGIQFNHAMIESMERRRANLQKTREKYKAEYDEIDALYLEACSTKRKLSKELEQKENQLPGKLRSLEQEADKIKTTKTGRQDLSSQIEALEKRIAVLRKEETDGIDNIMHSPAVRGLAEKTALTLVNKRHISRSEGDLKADAEDHGYGTNFSAPIVFAESLVIAHRHNRNYTNAVASGKILGPIIHTDLYADCNKVIGYGYRKYCPDELSATGVTYSMNPHTGLMKHINPTLPRRSKEQDQIVKSRGQV